MIMYLFVVGVIGFTAGTCLCIPVAISNMRLQNKLNNKPKTRFEDIDWSKEDSKRYKDIRDILRECIKSGDYNASVIEEDIDWLLEIIKRAQKINKRICSTTE